MAKRVRPAELAGARILEANDRELLVEKDGKRYRVRFSYEVDCCYDTSGDRHPLEYYIDEWLEVVEDKPKDFDAW